MALEYNSTLAIMLTIGLTLAVLMVMAAVARALSKITLPLKYNIRNLIVRKGSTLTTAFTIGLTVAVFLMVMALARGIDLTLATSGEPLNMIVMREGSTAELNSSLTRDNFKDIMYLDGVERENDQPLATAEIITLIYKARKGMNQGSNVTVRGVGPMSFKLR